MILQKRSRRKVTGGRYRPVVKRLANLGSLPTHTLVGKTSRKVRRECSGALKSFLGVCNVANVYDPVKKKSATAEIKTVVDNPANRNFVRRNILTKGAIIETSLGKARVTSRPGQEGSVNAVLVK